MPRPKHNRRGSAKLLSYVFFIVFFGGLLLLFFSRKGEHEVSNQLQVYDDSVVDAGRAAGCREHFAGASSAGRKVYSVVFDLGSTGNRVHVFRFKRKTDASDCSGVGCLQLEEELFEEDHNPLAAIGDPQKCVEVLEPLYEKALAYVPESHRPCTLIEFKATAGLRKAGKERADLILSAVREYYSKKDFWMRGAMSCAIMDGKDEGPMAWLTVNFLLNAFSDPHQEMAGIIDLGGGSTQIVFEPKRDEHMHPSFVYEQKVGNRYVKAYQHSYDGFGLHEAAQALLCRVSGTCAAAVGVRDDVSLSQEKHQFACFAGHYEDEASGIKNEKDSANFTRCAELFSTVVLHPGSEGCQVKTCGIGQVYQPSLKDFTGTLYAFSFIYDLMKDYLPKEGKPVVTPADIARAGKQECEALTTDQIRLMPKPPHSSLSTKYKCLYYSYIYALLVDGYGISEDRPLFSAKKIDGFETAWALGAGLVSLSKL